MIWKHSFLSNCVKTNSSGVIILNDKQYDLGHKYADCEGRQLIAVIGNDERKLISVNAYFPNNHKQGVTFAEQIYTKILKVQAKYPDHITFCARDMNVFFFCFFLLLSSFDSALVDIPCIVSGIGSILLFFSTHIYIGSLCSCFACTQVYQSPLGL